MADLWKCADIKMPDWERIVPYGEEQMLEVNNDRSGRPILLGTNGDDFQSTVRQRPLQRNSLFLWCS